MKHQEVVYVVIALILIFYVGLFGGSIITAGYYFKARPNLTFTINTYNLSCPEPVCPSQVCSLECPSCYVPVFVREAEITADARYYDLKDYNCNDFADELIKRLRNDGYIAKKCYGFHAGIYHAWVELDDIWIEATSGEVIEPKDRSKYTMNYCI